jgi:hypothetical protein
MALMEIIAKLPAMKNNFDKKTTSFNLQMFFIFHCPEIFNSEVMMKLIVACVSYDSLNIYSGNPGLAKSQCYHDVANLVPRLLMRGARGSRAWERGCDVASYYNR